jgi:hypothetical protein
MKEFARNASNECRQIQNCCSGTFRIQNGIAPGGIRASALLIYIIVVSNLTEGLCTWTGKHPLSHEKAV